MSFFRTALPHLPDEGADSAIAALLCTSPALNAVVTPRVEKPTLSEKLALFLLHFGATIVFSPVMSSCITSRKVLEKLLAALEGSQAPWTLRTLGVSSISEYATSDALLQSLPFALARLPWLKEIFCDSFDGKFAEIVASSRCAGTLQCLAVHYAAQAASAGARRISVKNLLRLRNLRELEVATFFGELPATLGETIKQLQTLKLIFVAPPSQEEQSAVVAESSNINWLAELVCGCGYLTHLSLTEHASNKCDLVSSGALQRLFQSKSDSVERFEVPLSTLELSLDRWAPSGIAIQQGGEAVLLDLARALNGGCTDVVRTLRINFFSNSALAPLEAAAVANVEKLQLRGCLLERWQEQQQQEQKVATPLHVSLLHMKQLCVCDLNFQNAGNLGGEALSALGSLPFLAKLTLVSMGLPHPECFVSINAEDDDNSSSSSNSKSRFPQLTYLSMENVDVANLQLLLSPVLARLPQLRDLLLISVRRNSLGQQSLTDEDLATPSAAAFFFPQLEALFISRSDWLRALGPGIEKCVAFAPKLLRLGLSACFGGPAGRPGLDFSAGFAPSLSTLRLLNVQLVDGELPALRSSSPSSSASSSLNSLTVVDFSNTVIRSISDASLECIAALPNLEELSFSDTTLPCRADFGRFLGRCRRLQRLTLRAISNLPSDADMLRGVEAAPVLKMLELSFCERVENVNFLSASRSLQSIDVFGSDALTVEGLMELATMPQLQVLRVGCELSQELAPLFKNKRPRLAFF